MREASTSWECQRNRGAITAQLDAASLQQLCEGYLGDTSAGVCLDT